MKMYKQLFYLINVPALFLLPPGCNNESSNTGDTATGAGDTAAVTAQLVFDKLVGTWQGPDGKSFERWTKNEDGSFQTTVFTINGSDTAWNENGKVYPENGQWVFENTVMGQNDGKAVRFVSSVLAGSSVQFSNPAHDFPTDVNYTFVDINTVHAFITGPDSKGSKDTIPFNYKRVE